MRNFNINTKIKAKGLKKDCYDVVVIGAGIGGLVCGCYLVKAGLKVLIVEQHFKPGGYCTSFEMNGYKFDVGVHYFGGIKRGILGRILNEIELTGRIHFKQFDPTDKIIMPDNVVYIRANYLDTIEEFKKSFPKEHNNIDKFFRFIMQNDFITIYSKVKKLTFKDVLDNYFKETKLKSTLGVLTGNIGASPDKAAAFPTIVLFRQYILDPGYYPSKGTIQAMPDVLAKYFTENGGDLVLSKRVTKILVKDDKANGIEIEGGDKIISDMVVSNADAKETFRNLLQINVKETKLIDKMIPTPSMFLAYLGLNISREKLREEIKGNFNIHSFFTYNVDKAFSISEKDVTNIGFVSCSFPSLHDSSELLAKATVNILKFMPYKSFDFWQKNRTAFMEQLIDKTNKVMPGLKNRILFKINATPTTLYKYTKNQNGSFAGWLPSLAQIKTSIFPQVTSLKNLYIVGHWCTMGYLSSGGIPSVVFSGRKAARFILENAGKKWDYNDFLL